ncbi:MAG: hypothetical protein ABMA64_43470 [Myxococcota bacterium]
MINTDPHGRVIGFAYHDGCVAGVALEADGKRVRIWLRSSSGQENVLVLAGVRALSVDGLREGNIVHAIRLHPIAEARVQFDVPPLVQARLGLDVGTLPVDEFVFLLEPSYGADFVAVCGDVELNPRP